MSKYFLDILFLVTLVVLYILPRKSDKYKFYWLIPLIIFLINMGIRGHLIFQKHISSDKITTLEKRFNTATIENTKLKSDIKALSEKTKNFDSLSENETKIGDLIFQREGSTINVTTLEKIVEKRIEEAREVAKTGNIDKALSIIEEAEKQYPNIFPDGGYILKATYLCKKAEYKQAINTLSKINEANLRLPNSQIYYNLKGFCYAKNSDFENAKKYLRLAIDADENSRFADEARNNLRIIENIINH